MGNACVDYPRRPKKVKREPDPDVVRSVQEKIASIEIAD